MADIARDEWLKKVVDGSLSPALRRQILVASVGGTLLPGSFDWTDIIQDYNDRIAAIQAERQELVRASAGKNFMDWFNGV